MPSNACEKEISAAEYPCRFANFTKVESMPKLDAPAKTINIYLDILLFDCNVNDCDNARRLGKMKHYKTTVSELLNKASEDPSLSREKELTSYFEC